jgi:endo-beta-N-acetylglucosaminidase D
MYKDKEVKNVNNLFVNVWRKNIFNIYVTEYGTALTKTPYAGEAGILLHMFGKFMIP